VVNKDVPDHALVVGNPARQIGWMCECGERLGEDLVCGVCGKKLIVISYSLSKTKALESLKYKLWHYIGKLYNIESHPVMQKAKDIV
jgi:hypothetical protein